MKRRSTNARAPKNQNASKAQLSLIVIGLCLFGVNVLYTLYCVLSIYAMLVGLDVHTFAQLYQWATDLQSCTNPWVMFAFAPVVRRHAAALLRCE